MFFETIRNFFRSFFFIIRHIVLFSFLYFALHPLFLSTFYDILLGLAYRFGIGFEGSMTIPFLKIRIPNSAILRFVPLSLMLSIKFGIYNIGVVSERDGIRTDFVFYITEFCTNMYSIISSFFIFFATVFLLLFTVVGNIYYINTRGYFALFTTTMNSDGNGLTASKTYEKSKEVASGKVITVIILNSMVVIVFFFLYYLIPQLPTMKDINITNYLKQIVVDSIFVYYLYTGISLQKVKNKKKQEEEEQIEKEKHDRRLAGI